MCARKDAVNEIMEEKEASKDVQKGITHTLFVLLHDVIL